jgi:hypothetical protein
VDISLLVSFRLDVRLSNWPKEMPLLAGQSGRESRVAVLASDFRHDENQLCTGSIGVVSGLICYYLDYLDVSRPTTAQGVTA